MTNFINIYPDKYNEIKSIKTNILKFSIIIDVICFYYYFKLYINYIQLYKTYNSTIYKNKNDKYTALDNIYKVKLQLTIYGTLLLFFNIFIYILFMSIYKNRNISTQLYITFYPLVFLYNNKLFTLISVFIILLTFSIYIIIKNKNENKIEPFQDNNNNNDNNNNDNNNDNKSNNSVESINKVRNSNYPYFILYNEFNNITYAIIFIIISIITVISYLLYNAYKNCFNKYSYNTNINFTQKESFTSKFNFIFKCFFNNAINKFLVISNKIIEYIIVFFTALMYLIFLLLPYIGISLFFYITIKWFKFSDKSGENIFGRPV